MATNKDPNQEVALEPIENYHQQQQQQQLQQQQQQQAKSNWQRSWGATFFLIAGAAEVVFSTFLWYDSEHYYLEGIYLGGIVCFFALIGIFVSNVRVWSLLLLGILFAGIALVVIQALDFVQINNLQTCAIATTSPSNTCGITSFFADIECYGSSSQFAQAESCVIANGDDTNTCICLKSGSSTCYKFKGITDCGILLQDLFEPLLIALCISCLITFCAFIMFLSLLIVVATLATASVTYKRVPSNQQPANKGTAPPASSSQDTENETLGNRPEGGALPVTVANTEGGNQSHFEFDDSRREEKV